jgi:transcriptional regulator with XRE-family HTH domain
LTAPRTTKPLDEALPTLLAERDVSLRALAERIEVDPGHLSKAIRRLEGKRPTRALLERIAAALELDPAFFPEYRHELVVEALESEPELRDELYRRLVKPERAGKPRTRRQA